MEINDYYFNQGSKYIAYAKFQLKIKYPARFRPINTLFRGSLYLFT